MSKQLILLFAIIPVMLASTCADIPSFQKLKEQAATLNSEQLNNVISNFESATPTVQTGLDFCSDFNGKTGCCTQDFIAAAKDAIEKSTEKLKAKKPIYGILLKQLDQSIKRCKKGTAKGGLLRFLQETTTQADKNPNDDKQFVSEYKRCQVRIIQATRRFKRGAFCTLCIDPSNISTYFNGDGTLKMDTEAFEQYKQEMGEGFKCLSDFNDKFVAKTKEATDLLDANACPKLQEKIQSQLDAAKVCSGDQCLTAWLDKVRLFGDNVAETVALDENTYSGDINANRRLLVSYGDISPVSGGFKSYIEDSSDNNVSIDGVTYESGSQYLTIALLAMIIILSLLI